MDSVKRKLLSIMNPRKTDEELINNSDMSGPFLIAVVLGMLLLMVSVCLSKPLVERKNAIRLHIRVLYHWLYFPILPHGQDHQV